MRTKEKQYEDQVELHKDFGFAALGMKTSHTWHVDPKRLLFSLSRYKFTAKMLSGKENVIEIGCGDAFCSRIVQQEVKRLLVTDIDPIFIDDAQKTKDESWPLEAQVHNFVDDSMKEMFDAAYCLDVFEHISKRDADAFVRNICNSLADDGVFIVGIPSLSSQKYASKLSKQGHVNCMDGSELKAFMEKYFDNVFMLCMNDENIHSGFFPMAHYLFAVCAGVKR